MLVDETGRTVVTPEMIATQTGVVRGHRTADGHFDVVVDGYSEPSRAGAELVAAYERAGATWWLEGINGFRGTVEAMLARVEAGPPSSRD
jgi:hypothetical protein